MKKLMSLLLAVLVFVSCSQPALAQGTGAEPQLVVSTVAAMPGDEVSVPITLQNNPGIGVINPKFVFDSSRLQWLGYEEGGLKGWTVTEKAGVWLGNSDSDFNGVILTLRFKVLEAARDGLAEVRLICGDGDAYNYAEELILFELISGGVQVGEQAHEHSSGPETKENEISPGCTKPGSYDAVVKCSACGAEISRVTVPVPAIGHRYDAPRFQWSEDHSEATAYFICVEKDDVQELEAKVSHRPVADGEEYTASVEFQDKYYNETIVLSPGSSEASPAQSADTSAAADAASPAEAAKDSGSAADPKPEAAAEAAASAKTVNAGRSFPILPILVACCLLVGLVILLHRRSRGRNAKKK